MFTFKKIVVIVFLLQKFNLSMEWIVRPPKFQRYKSGQILQPPSVSKSLEFGVMKSLRSRPEFKTSEFRPEFKISKFQPEFKTSQFQQEFRTSEFQPEFKTSEFQNKFRTSEFRPEFTTSEFQQEFRTLDFPSEFKISKFPSEFRTSEFQTGLRTSDFQSNVDFRKEKTQSFYSAELTPSQPPVYEFRYKIHDPKEKNYQEKAETRVGDTVRGYYSVREPNGYMRLVKYISDENGFHTEVSHHQADYTRGGDDLYDMTRYIT